MEITNKLDAKKKTSRIIVYQPVTPACNKTLRRKWDHHLFNNHRERVKNARSLIDNKAPRIFFPMNLKKAQVNTIIAHNNPSITCVGRGTTKG